MQFKISFVRFILCFVQVRDLIEAMQFELIIDVFLIFNRKPSTLLLGTPRSYGGEGREAVEERGRGETHGGQSPDHKP